MTGQREKQGNNEVKTFSFGAILFLLAVAVFVSAEAQQNDGISVVPAKHSYVSGDRIEFKLHVSDTISGASIVWTSTWGAKGKLDDNMQALSVVAPEVKRPRVEQIILHLQRVNGSVVAENITDIYILPKAASPVKVPVVFYDPLKLETSLEENLASRGFQVSHLGTTINKEALLITTIFDDQVSRQLQSGGRAIILIDSKDALPETAPIKIKERSSDWDKTKGRDWVLSDVEPFNEVASSKSLGSESTAISPRFVILGVHKENYDDVLAGVFAYDSADDVVLAMKIQAAGGRVFLTTFRFNEYGTDAYATGLLDSIIRYTMSPRFLPKMNWHIREE